jgi:hypothetical protein
MGPVIFLILILLFAAGLVIAGGFIIYKGLTARKWSEASGRIIESKLADTQLEANGIKYYENDISYTYSAGNKTYTGKTLDFMEWANPAFIKELKATKYYKGKNLTVYYNPQKPEMAALEPGLKLKYFLLPLIGLTIISGIIFLSA